MPGCVGDERERDDGASMAWRTPRHHHASGCHEGTGDGVPRRVEVADAERHTMPTKTAVPNTHRSPILAPVRPDVCERQ